MNKSSKILAAVSVAVGCAALVFWLRDAFNVNDPMYHGRHLSAWVGDLTFKTPPRTPAESASQVETDTLNSTEIREKAKEAVLAMGTNAIPYLLEEIRVLCGTVNKQGGYSDTAWETSHRLENARYALKILGPVAKPAVPTLAGWIREGDTAFIVCAADTLNSIDPEVAAETLTQALSNRDYFIRWMAADYLWAVRSNAEMAVPLLLQCLNDKSSDTNNPLFHVREASARVLGGIGKDSEIVVPALIQTLQHDEYPSVRQCAARALGDFHTNAVLAVPDLYQASTNDADPVVRLAAVEALKRIQPAAP